MSRRCPTSTPGARGLRPGRHIRTATTCSWRPGAGRVGTWPFILVFDHGETPDLFEEPELTDTPTIEDRKERPMYDMQQALAREIDRDRMRAAARWRLARDLRAPATGHGLVGRIRRYVVERARSVAAPAYSPRGEASDCA